MSSSNGISHQPHQSAHQLIAKLCGAVCVCVFVFVPVGKLVLKFNSGLTFLSLCLAPVLIPIRTLKTDQHNLYKSYICYLLLLIGNIVCMFELLLFRMCSHLKVGYSVI